MLIFGRVVVRVVKFGMQTKKKNCSKNIPHHTANRLPNKWDQLLKLLRLIRKIDTKLLFPIIFSYGPWCTDAKSLISDIGRLIGSINSETISTTYLINRISIEIQCHNASCIMRTLPWMEIFFVLFIQFHSVTPMQPLQHRVVRQKIYFLLALSSNSLFYLFTSSMSCSYLLILHHFRGSTNSLDLTECASKSNYWLVMPLSDHKSFQISLDVEVNGMEIFGSGI